MTKTVKLLAALFALLLVAAACSNDDSSTTETGDDSSSSDDTGSEDSGSDDGAADDTDSGSDDGAADDADSGDGAAEDDDAMDDDADSDDGTDASEDDASDAASEDDGSADEGAVGTPGAIVVTAVSFTDSTVTVRNDGADPVDFTGHFTCNRPAYGDMPGVILEPGATLDIDVSSLDIRASGGEFGLYSARSFDSPDAMLAYVQWGGPGNGRASVAVEAGLIAEGEFVDNGGEDITIG